ncbi:MAG: dTDP-4-dehydrorhamnose 3,5-epimerase family protein [Holosporales bacterium]|nr:dTDP-4-dehydrorhamnose 3,5-epimerase family protein [Holosporales bacterium]
MSQFTITDCPLAGLKLVKRTCFEDVRGYLSRFFCAEDLKAAGWKKPVAQINHSYTLRKGTIRGLHFQYPPHAEAKFINCLRGSIWDIAIDLRAGSPTFLKSHAEVLSADNKHALLIPEGYAHGFQSLTEDVEVLYLLSHPYKKEAEGGVCFSDPALGIAWPLPATVVSERDKNHPPLTKDFRGLVL